MKAKFLLHLLVLLIVQFLYLNVSAQNRTITGSVSSKVTGQPLSGATVAVKGSNTATTTDNSGSFTLSVAPSAKFLVISYVGLSQPGDRGTDIGYGDGCVGRNRRLKAE